MLIIKRIGARIGIIIGQFLFLVLIDFALGGITYFTYAIFGLMPASPLPSPEREYVWVLINNFSESILALVILNLSLAYIHYLSKVRFWQYFIINLSLYILEGMVYEILFDKDPNFIKFVQAMCFPRPIYFFFQLHIMIATSLVYYLYTRDQTRTHKITEQEYQLLKLNELKTKAELEALQAKVNPHFLYNSLNSIASLVHQNPDKAEKMILLLAKFFRYSTQIQRDYYSTIAQELEMVQTYLEVEQVRFEDRLNYEIYLESPELSNYLIPSFLLQPLVENAIKHGIAKISENGKIIIKVFMISQANQLGIIILDNGSPFPESLNSGYGLQSTYDKLRLLGGKDASLEIKNDENKFIEIHLQARKEREEILVKV